MLVLLRCPGDVRDSHVSVPLHVGSVDPELRPAGSSRWSHFLSHAQHDQTHRIAGGFPISHIREFKYITHLCLQSAYEGTTWRILFVILLLMSFVKHNFVAIWIAHIVELVHLTLFVDCNHISTAPKSVGLRYVQNRSQVDYDWRQWYVWNRKLASCGICEENGRLPWLRV
jgi:hypothetical protein